MDVASARTGAYWAGLAAREHLVQFYEEDFQILDSLEGFVAAGLRSGQGVIVIATAGHLHQLEQRLRAGWIDPSRARYERRYVPVLASECLDTFMRDGEIDEGRFARTMDEIVASAAGDSVRVFGEMVSLLWSAGHPGATMRLERLWHVLVAERNLQLLCAYSKRAFSRDEPGAMRAICDAHSGVIAA